MADPACAECTVEDQPALPNTAGAVAPRDTSPTKPYDPLDASTFAPPAALPAASVTIEFCDRCRWLHRATWVSTELLLTFPPPALAGVHLVPLNAEDTAGRFRVWLHTAAAGAPVLVWDRKIEDAFPELKVLKQRVRDHIQPGKSLGHSDKPTSSQTSQALVL
ncbi:Rdx family-domain-containing protein [Phellopilus nigrolimitatus]|nr:Rdx family-domain-containing protein [Phellopilus nigrolimitatus]